ncbi:MAG: GTP-binding protein [Candidatus Heimdallarchaeota archaeon]|nr:GTP-binding protein [Candidatus Heimdallarchaeota archaeon]
MAGITLACKITLLGDGRVGKTSLRRTYLGQNFSKTYSMTIGADFAAKTLTFDSNRITANIWDLSGQHKFKIMRETYYKGVSGAILVYDITRKETFDSLNNWINELIKNNNGEMVPILIIANKVDIRDENSLPTEVGEGYAKEISERYNLNVDYVEASALTGDNVEKAFELLIKNLYDDFKRQVESH